MGTLLGWLLLMRSHCPANSLTPCTFFLACWKSFPARCPSADFAVPGYNGFSTTSSLPCMQRWPYQKLVFFQVVLHNNCKVLTKVAPGQPASISCCDNILLTPKLSAGISFISAFARLHISCSILWMFTQASFATV